MSWYASFACAVGPWWPPRPWWAVRRAVGVVCVAACLAGCAINDRGLVRVRRYENDSAVLVHVTAIGAHLVTYSGDAGLTFGYSDRTYVFPRSAAPVRIDAATLHHPEAWQPAASLHPAAADTPHAAAPIMRIARTAGLSLDTNRNRAGLSLGFAHRYALWLPTTGSRVVLIHHAAGDDAGAQVIISQEDRE